MNVFYRNSAKTESIRIGKKYNEIFRLISQRLLHFQLNFYDTCWLEVESDNQISYFHADLVRRETGFTQKLVVFFLTGFLWKTKLAEDDFRWCLFSKNFVIHE